MTRLFIVMVLVSVLKLALGIIGLVRIVRYEPGGLDSAASRLSQGWERTCGYPDALQSGGDNIWPPARTYLSQLARCQARGPFRTRLAPSDVLPALVHARFSYLSGIGRRPVLHGDVEDHAGIRFSHQAMHLLMSRRSEHAGIWRSPCTYSTRANAASN